MKFGIDEKSWLELERLLWQPLKKAKAKVWIFGSRARGDHQEFSDLDVLIEFESEAPQGFVGSLRMDLEDSCIPIKIDLVERKNLAESYAPYVEKDKIRI